MLPSQSGEDFQTHFQAPLSMAPDISPERVLLFHLLGGMSWGAGLPLGRRQTASATVIHYSLSLQLTSKQ